MLFWSNHLLLLIAGWALAGLSISALFVIGHDAAHGALFRSRRLCHVVGQLAMLPSLHPYEAWAYGHNRIHHAFTTCQDYDFVWHPISPGAVRGVLTRRKAAPPHRVVGLRSRRLLRAQRLVGKADVGGGTRRFAAMLRRERFLMLGVGVLASAVVGSMAFVVHGSLGAAAWTWVKVLVIPWLIWNTLIGWAVYLHHIHPEIGWHPRGQWRKFRGQVENTTTLRFPRWAEFFAHNIFFHAAHHVEPRIPFYNLPEATRVLQDRYGTSVREAPYRHRDYVEVTRRCKLYDFDAAVWLDYDGRSALRPSREHAGTLPA